MTVSNPIDDEIHEPRRQDDKEQIKQGNPGKPQSDYEHPAPGPSDEPPEGFERQAE